MNAGTIERLAAGVILAGFPGTSVPADTRALIDRGLRSFILFGRNVGTGEEVRALTAELRNLAGDDAIVAIDHEGGRVNRLRESASPWPSPMAWAAGGDPLLVQRSSRLMAEELAALGFNLNLAPVADVLDDFRNPAMSNRCFSDDPKLVATSVSAFVTGHREAGVGTTAKHFPGHGGTAVDSHHELPQVDWTLEYLQEHDLIPFVAAVQAGVSALMTSHIWYSALDSEETPATVSANVIQLARDGLGFQGPIVTDSLEMGAIARCMTPVQAGVRALLAGCDLLAVCHRSEDQQRVITGLVDAVQMGILPVRRLEEANQRVDSLRRQVGRWHARFPAGGEADARAIASRAVTLVRDHHHILPLRLPSTTPLGVITFPTGAVTLVENENMPDSALARSLRSIHPSILALVSTGADDVLGKLDGVSTIIVGTSLALARPEQAALIQSLLNLGKDVIVVGLRDPSDALAFPNAPCFLVAYDDSVPAAEAAAAIIFGRMKAIGRLPIEIPGIRARGEAGPPQ